MNIDIRNYGKYRLTSHGGRAYDLYNRETGDVFSVSKKDHDYITTDDYPSVACQLVESIYLRARKPNGIDVA